MEYLVIIWVYMSANHPTFGFTNCDRKIYCEKIASMIEGKIPYKVNYIIVKTNRTLLSMPSEICKIK